MQMRMHASKSRMLPCLLEIKSSKHALCTGALSCGINFTCRWYMVTTVLTTDDGVLTRRDFWLLDGNGKQVIELLLSVCLCLLLVLYIAYSLMASRLL